MEIVGLSRYYKSRYPHEFSGGQRQRIGIARALILNPKLVICDEPVSALDVSIQAQVLNLLKDLQKEFHLTYIFIAHGLGAVKYISDRIAVMYLGKMMEMATTKEIFEHPKHPYTKILLNSYPIPDPHMRNREQIVVEGDVPSPANPPLRVSYKMPVCERTLPREGAGSEGKAACRSLPFSTKLR
ncbi:ABC transporter ATP-binding protein [Terrilactibacillus sp. S3-3]|nr:ABC transporter ATP-binding protein [Terrilactibacillus sp. S3-3]